jgi:FKBP-type peptidyl-prolyl cis-trans isomerase FkpA
MKYSFLVLLTVLFNSCSLNDTDTEQEQTEPIDYTIQNENEIKAYIEENNLNAIRTESGLYYVLEEAGTGKQPTANSNVTVAYKGFYINKKVFDQSSETGVSFSLQKVIQGWTEGIPYFKEGGSGILLVPSHLAYGSYDYKGIPGGSVLIFNVKLISVN